MLIARGATVRFVMGLTWGPLLAFVALGIAFPLIHDLHGLDRVALPLGITGALATALAIFLGFRNSAGYDRWWEARKLWGRLVNASRTWARQTLTLVWAPSSAVPPTEVDLFKRELVFRQIAFVHALRYHLRAQTDRFETLERWLSDHEVAELRGSTNVPLRIVQRQAERIAEAQRKGWLDELRLLELDRTLTEIVDAQGGCERIKNTQIPRHYDFFPRLFFWVYALLLPMSLATEVGWLTPALSVPLSLLFHVLEISGRTIEDPFENRPTDTQMTYISATIEANLRELLGEPDVQIEEMLTDGCLY